jgi:hypothetical protein
MESALVMLDKAGERVASTHLDLAIAELGLREQAMELEMVTRLSGCN